MQYWISKGVVKERPLAGGGDIEGDEGEGEGQEVAYEIIENQAEREKLHQQRGDIEVRLSHLGASFLSLPRLP
jgi:hypothetical protein